MPHLTNVLPPIVTACLTAFVTAGLLWCLLARLGDDAGAMWAGWFAVATGSLTVVSAAGLSLVVTVRDSADV